MIRKSILTLTLFLLALAVWAAKANKAPFMYTQPDGSRITIFGHGDEHYHWYTTADGVLLVRNDNAYYVADIASDGKLTATTTIAHERAERNEAERKLVMRQDKQAFKDFLSSASLQTRASMEDEILVGSTLFPHKGSPTAIVILVEFQDTLFSISNPRQSFNEYLNATDSLPDRGFGEWLNYGSVRQFFNDCSFGQFIPQFDVYGPVKLSNKLAHYGKDTSNTVDIRYTDMIKEACQLMDDSLNFADYDANNDGYIDLVYIIYAGYSESISGNSEDCLWPKSGTISGGSFDGKKLYRYGINNELNGTPTSYNVEPMKRINGIGLFCHEFSHTMGLPDLYESGNSTCHNDNELEYWDLMDGGEYVRNGYYPTPYTPWEREVMGWMTIDTLVGEQQVTLTPIQEGGKAYKIINNNNASGNEYYIVENIQERGWYDAKVGDVSIKGHGMLVYHVDYNAASFRLGNYPNSTYGHPRMTIVAADGQLLSVDMINDTESKSLVYYTSMNGDPFPGTAQVDSLTDVMTRKDGKQMLYTYTGKLNKPIYNIVENEDGIITFDFMKDSTTAIRQSIVTVGHKDDNIYTLDGRYAGNKLQALPEGIYIIGKRKVIRR